jgi:hypothetical protein
MATTRPGSIHISTLRAHHGRGVADRCVRQGLAPDRCANAPEAITHFRVMRGFPKNSHSLLLVDGLAVRRAGHVTARRAFNLAATR